MAGMEPTSDTSSPATDIAAVRGALRDEARQARAELEAPYRGHKSAEVCKRLTQALTLTLGIKGLAPEEATLAVYAAFPEELDLHDFIEDAYERGCRVAFPCMMKDALGVPDAANPAHLTEQTMEMRLVDAERFRAGDVPFLTNPLRRYEHASADLEAFPYVAADELTLIVVPVVGFDAEGNRLGYGAGNYDRYLAQIPADCRIVGAAFAEQQVDPIPTEPHDIPIAIVAL